MNDQRPDAMEALNQAREAMESEIPHPPVLSDEGPHDAASAKHVDASTPPEIPHTLTNEEVQEMLANQANRIDTAQGVVSMPGAMGQSNNVKTREVSTVDLTTQHFLLPKPAMYIGANSTTSLEKRYERQLNRTIEEGMKILPTLQGRKRVPVEIYAVNSLVFMALAYKCSERVEYLFYKGALHRQFDLVGVLRRFIAENADYLAMLAPYVQVAPPKADPEYGLKKALAEGGVPEFSETPAEVLPGDAVLAQAQDVTQVTDLEVREVKPVPSDPDPAATIRAAQDEVVRVRGNIPGLQAQNEFGDPI